MTWSRTPRCSDPLTFAPGALHQEVDELQKPRLLLLLVALQPLRDHRLQKDSQSEGPVAETHGTLSKLALRGGELRSGTSISAAPPHTTPPQHLPLVCAVQFFIHPSPCHDSFHQINDGLSLSVTFHLICACVPDSSPIRPPYPHSTHHSRWEKRWGNLACNQYKIK